MKVKHIARPREERGDAWSRWDYGDYLVKVYDDGHIFWMAAATQRTATITKADADGLARVTVQDLDQPSDSPGGFLALELVPHFMARDLCRGWITGGFTTKGAGQ